MKAAILIVWMFLQMLAWPIFCAGRMRSHMAFICYLATFAAFWLGWFAK